MQFSPKVILEDFSLFTFNNDGADEHIYIIGVISSNRYKWHKVCKEFILAQGPVEHMHPIALSMHQSEDVQSFCSGHGRETAYLIHL